MLSRDDIRRALLALAGELKAMSARCEIVVVGGAAVVLLYGARVLRGHLVGGREEVWSLIEPHLVPGRETKAHYAFYRSPPNDQCAPLAMAALSLSPHPRKRVRVQPAHRPS